MRSNTSQEASCPTFLFFPFAPASQRWRRVLLGGQRKHREPFLFVEPCTNRPQKPSTFFCGRSCSCATCKARADQGEQEKHQHFFCVSRPCVSFPPPRATGRQTSANVENCAPTDGSNKDRPAHPQTSIDNHRNNFISLTHDFWTLQTVQNCHKDLQLGHPFQHCREGPLRTMRKRG